MSDNSEPFEENKSEMLEDEEMPTFISVSSKEISLPYTDANNELLPIDSSSANPLLRGNDTADDYEAQSRSPSTEERDDEANDDNEEDSVCVLSSGDDADDADPSSRSYDEDVDEEEDVDDEDDEDIDDMDEIEGEEEEVSVAEDGPLLGDFSEEEIEKEDVMSDDMALRSDKPMEINHQRRSQSLQDLSEYGAPPGRKSFITGGNKYNRVQSKVKRYIQDLKERSRRSAEVRLKAREDARKSEEFEIKALEEEEEQENCQKSAKGRRSIKDYAEKALKDLEMREDLSQADEEAFRQETENCTARPNNNLQNKGNLKTENEEHQQNQMRCEFKTANEIYKAKKLNMNGEVTSEALKNIKIPKGISLNYTLNGQTQGQNILDVRSIGYDEYMRGGSNSSSEKNIGNIEVEKKLPPEEINSPKCKLEITNIRSETQTEVQPKDLQNTEETPMEVVEREEDAETIIEVEGKDKMSKEALAEIAIIQTQLNQKTTQCKEFRDAYEKTLSENFELKQEVENLKKTIAKLTAKKPAPQLIAVAIQTDPPPLPAPPTIEPKSIPAADNCLNPKLSSSSMGSAFSTNEHWTESAGSLPMSNGSIRPLPNLTPLSNADDSFIGVSSTPPRTPRQPSHAFQTSSKIIKMLSSITRKTPKTDGALNGEESLPNMFSKVASGAGVSSYHSPLNHRGSNKRKASEMPENASFLQPPKIPHTSSGSHRSHRRTKSEFKFPGDYVKLGSQPFATQSADVSRNLENLEDSRAEDEPRDDLDSGVKCFTFREDENDLERSFLIQAEDEKIQDPAKDGERGMGVVRECGPYLLGNVEVRMTEVNGTINIWGKEVSQETNAEDELEEETDIEEELNERRACDCWHKTPNVRHSNVGPTCSTNKKMKIPPLRLNESGCSKSCYSPSTPNVDKFKERQQHVRNFEDEGNCRNCESHSASRILNKFKRFSNFGDDEAPANSSNNYSCNWNNENCDHPTIGRISRHFHGDSQYNTPNQREAGRCSRLDGGSHNRQSKTEENLNRNQSSRFTNNFEDDNATCRHDVRKNSAPEDDDVFKRPSTSNARVNDTCWRNDSCRSHSPSLSNQSNEPLLSHHPREPPEARRRRSSGKRVRGILMDFFRGCGDCGTMNGPDNKVSPGIIPQIRVRPSTPPPTLLSQTQQRTASYGSTNKRCVHTECCLTCARRIEKSVATEIKSQLEIFGAEMERLHSRSQALLGMLHTLQTADTN